jgi:molybdate transport system substrate-binding protein
MTFRSSRKGAAEMDRELRKVGANLNILSGGAAQGLVGRLATEFKKLTGLDISGDFGAVGAMADKLRGGTPTDILVLTSALIATLAKEGLADRASIKDIGRVETTLAVRESDPLVSAPDAVSLRAALLAADAIFVPDTKTSTAGIHVAKVLSQLGIADQLESRLKIYPNGATAMRHMAETDAKRPIGCTQATEILATKGIKLSGALPKGCDLATVYTAAVTVRAARRREAQILIELLTATDQANLRERAGFLPL